VSGRARWAAWLTGFSVALALYTATADHGVQWQDSGWQQYRIVTGQIDHPLGLALVHPVQYYLGRAAIRLLPVEPAFAITLVSSAAAAVAIGNLALIVMLVARRLAAAAIAPAALMLAHTFWQQAAHTESYALAAALLTAEWLCLALYATDDRPGALLALALLNGLGLANHLLALLATPVDAVLILHASRRGRLPRNRVLAAIGLWILGTLPFSSLVLGTAIGTGDVIGTLHSALFGGYASNVLNTSIGLRTILLSLGYLFYNFPGLTVPLAYLGLCSGVPRVFIRAIRWQLLIYGLFVIRYTITDQYAFFFPVYALLALCAGLGIAKVLQATSPRRRRGILALAAFTSVWTPLVYLATASALATRGLLAQQVGHKPYRDGYLALFVPWGLGADYATTLNTQAYRLADNDGLILVTDSMIRFALQYAQAAGHGSLDVRVMQMETAATAETSTERRVLMESYLARRRPVVLVPRDRDHPVTCVPEAQWRRDGDLYVLTGIRLVPTTPDA
jgi:hypothetical protein